MPEVGGAADIALCVCCTEKASHLHFRRALMKVPDSMHPDCRVFCGLMLASALGAVRHACRACFMVLRTQIQKRGRLSKSFLDCFEGMPTGKAAAAPFTARNWSQLSEGAPPPATKCPGPCPQTRRRNQDQRQVVVFRLLAKNVTKPLPASFFFANLFPSGGTEVPT